MSIDKIHETKDKDESNVARTIPKVLCALSVIALVFVIYHGRNAVMFHPKGEIAAEQLHLIIIATVLMLVIVLPVFFLAYTFAWRYREGRPESGHENYQPNWNHNRKLEWVWWILPAIIVAVLSVIIWNSSHQLDPYRALASKNPPITIQVIALNWKWLFLYPQQGIATLNYVEFPVDTPVDFQLTADAPMNSFWIPQLAGQIYAMPGMQTNLNLMADTIGDYAGSSANISGDGFSGMTFDTHVVSDSDFQSWVRQTQKSTNQLTMQSYTTLTQPSAHVQPESFVLEDDGIFDDSQMKYMMPGMQGTLPSTPDGGQTNVDPSAGSSARTSASQKSAAQSDDASSSAMPGMDMKDTNMPGMNMSAGGGN